MPEPTFQHPDFAPDFSQFEREPPGPPAAPPSEARPARDIEAWPLAFTGDGGVYFGVWIVNILLTIVTLGLFTPWARRRTIRYFYGHTLVAGSPLEFTAGIRSMVFGFLLFAAFYIALNVASETGQALLYGVIVAGGVLLAPFLWGSAMRFRLGHTRWRGLRLRFTAGWGEVYRASWPDETRMTGTLADIEAKVGQTGIERTALILVGRVLAAEGFVDSSLYASARHREIGT